MTNIIDAALSFLGLAGDPARASSATPKVSTSQNEFEKILAKKRSSTAIVSNADFKRLYGQKNNGRDALIPNVGTTEISRISGRSEKVFDFIKLNGRQAKYFLNDRLPLYSLTHKDKDGKVISRSTVYSALVRDPDLESNVPNSSKTILTTSRAKVGAGDSRYIYNEVCSPVLYKPLDGVPRAVICSRYGFNDGKTIHYFKTTAERAEYVAMLKAEKIIT